MGPSMLIAVADCEVLLPPRTIGVLTGCHSSVQAGRIPLVDCASKLAESWRNKGYKYTDGNGVNRVHGVSSFVDNVYCSAKQADTCAEILDGIESELIRSWGLTLNVDSRQIMQCKNAPDSVACEHRYKLVTCMKTLGQRISNDGCV